MADGFNYDDIPTSKIDGSWLKVVRIARCWDLCHHHWKGGDAIGLINVLDLIWFELSADATDPEKEEIKEINQRITYNRKMKRISSYWGAIRDKWEFLFKVEKHQGLGKRYRDPLEDELD